MKWFNMGNFKKGYVPMEHDTILSSYQCPSIKVERENMKDVPYASAVGSIIYTRPDLAFDISMTSKYQQNSE